MTNTTSQFAPALPEPPAKQFTVEEANRALPYIRRVVEDVNEVYERIIELRRQLEHVEPTESDEIDETGLEGKYQSEMARLSGLVNELHQVGVELAHFRDGVIDFPAHHAGREVVLTWERGESEVGYWRDVDAAFAERHEIADFGIGRAA